MGTRAGCQRVPKEPPQREEQSQQQAEAHESAREVCAGVAEQAQGEEHRPCDQVHLHAARNERVNVPELPWIATSSMK